jgi:zinc/manganese transport system substrate-binding protein
MRLLKKLSLLIFSLFFLCTAVWAKLNIVATTSDLAAIAREIGSDRVQVESLTAGIQDPHFADPKPSLIVKLMKADLFIETGMELEIGWAPVLIQSSGNPRIQRNAVGYLDASSAITPLEVPQNPTRAMGDVHPGGNPHYLTDPENGKLAANLIAEKLSELSPKDADFFRKNLADFEKRLNENMKQWSALLEPYAGTKFVSYHRDIVYFARRFKLIPSGEIEPKPGIPPTASHTAELIETMTSKKISMILTMPWFETRTPSSIARQTNAVVVTFASRPGAVPEAKDYISTVNYNVKSVFQVLNKH